VHRIDFSGHGRRVLPVAGHPGQGRHGPWQHWQQRVFRLSARRPRQYHGGCKKAPARGGQLRLHSSGKDIHFQGSGDGGKFLIFQKTYRTLAGVPRPQAIFGHEREVKGHPFLGNEDARLQVLLPDHPTFDLAVNIFTYQPGATLPFVETHIMEHGLLMLKGQGIYRLDTDYHPVQAGDVIWMAPYCPQWFVAMGKTPASYIYYKDVNREPL